MFRKIILISEVRTISTNLTSIPPMHRKDEAIKAAQERKTQRFDVRDNLIYYKYTSLILTAILFRVLHI